MLQLRKLGLLIVAVCISTSVFAQNGNDIKSILEEAQSLDREVRVQVSDDDNIYIGKVQSISETEVVIATATTRFTLLIRNITDATIIDPNNPETRWFKNVSRNRLFITPTALNNGAGTGYYQNIYIFLSNIGYSPVDFLTLNVGFSNIPRLTLDGDFFYLGAKLSTQIVPNLYAGVNGTLFSAGDDRTGFVNFLGTYSNNSFDLTLGLGYAVDEGETSSPLFMFGFQYRLAQRLSLVTENFFLPDSDDTVIAIGPRFLGKRITTDLGFFFLPEIGADIALPYVSFTVAF